MSQFKPMLAAPAPASLTFPLVASPKLDGIRCLIRGGQAVSRTLKPIPNRYVQAVLEGLPDGLDGELIVGKPTAPDCMQVTTSGVMSRDGEPDFTYWVFDDWGAAAKPFYPVGEVSPDNSRYLFAAAIVDFYELALRIVPHTFVASAADLEAYESAQVAAGFEGVMLREPNGAYKFGRSTAREGGLLKLKRFETSEAVILGAVELMHNANAATVDALGHTERSTAKAGLVPAGTLGAVVARDLVTGVEFEIGTGFSADDRATLWRDALAGRLAGKVCSYQHFAGGVKDKPRFPSWRGFRHADDMGEPDPLAALI